MASRGTSSARSLQRLPKLPTPERARELSVSGAFFATVLVYSRLYCSTRYSTVLSDSVSECMRDIVVSSVELAHVYSLSDGILSYRVLNMCNMILKP